MGRLLQFLRTIMVGGLLFLVPIVVLIAIGDKALGLVRAFSDPLAEEFPIVSAHTPMLFASVLLIGVCFVLGLLALTAPARLAIAWLENNCLSKVPGYVFLKGAGESALGIEDGTAYPVVLARIEEAWQFGFLVETLEGGHLAVFIPDAPNPLSGSVFFMGPERVKRSDISAAGALKCLRQLGAGSHAILPNLSD